MNGTLVETGPKMDWTRDNKIFDCYLLWKNKVENYFCSILADATPQQKTGYLRLWMGDEGVPLIKKWISTGKIDFSDPIGKPASGNRARVPPSNGFILQTFWDLLEPISSNQYHVTNITSNERLILKILRYLDRFVSYNIKSNTI